MPSLSLLSDTELLARVAAVVQTERIATAQVVEHLVEVERRRLYLDQACSSLYTYCRERLGYSEDAALKRARVARLALRLPRVLDELRTGAIHLTGLFLLDRYLNEENAEGLLVEARGKSRRELEKILAIRFPRPDVPSSMEALGTATLALDNGASGGRAAPSKTEASGPNPWFSCPETATSAACGGAGGFRSRVEPLSAERYRVEFTASATLRAKIEQARELASHALPNGDLALLFERALDGLIDCELKRRIGAEKPRRSVKPRSGSRHVPLAVAKQVRERDGNQCSFVDSAGRRCTERRWLTLEHRHPFSLGGPATVENLCVLCKAHNEHAARRVFGEAFIASRLAKREGRSRSIRIHDDAPGRRSPRPTHSDSFTKVRSALTHMGFCQRTVASTLSRLRDDHPTLEAEPLLRAALELLTPYSVVASPP
jgi:hypothetical protein